MARYRNNLPQLAGGLFLTDGGIGNKKGVGHGKFVLLFSSQAGRPAQELVVMRR